MKRKPIKPSQRFRILRRDNYTCQYCGRSAPHVELHVDHKKPVKFGGDNSDDNLITACSECNLGKSASYSFNSVGNFSSNMDEPKYIQDMAYLINLWCAITDTFPSIHGFATIAKLMTIYPNFAIEEAILESIAGIDVDDPVQLEKAFTCLGEHCRSCMASVEDGL